MFKTICHSLLLHTCPLVCFTKPSLAISSNRHFVLLKQYIETESTYNRYYRAIDIDVMRSYCNKGRCYV